MASLVVVVVVVEVVVVEVVAVVKADVVGSGDAVVVVVAVDAKVVDEHLRNPHKIFVIHWQTGNDFG